MLSSIHGLPKLYSEPLCKNRGFKLLSFCCHHLLDYSSDTLVRHFPLITEVWQVLLSYLCIVTLHKIWYTCDSLNKINVAKAMLNMVSVKINSFISRDKKEPCGYFLTVTKGGKSFSLKLTKAQKLCRNILCSKNTKSAKCYSTVAIVLLVDFRCQICRCLVFHFQSSVFMKS